MVFSRQRAIWTLGLVGLALGAILLGLLAWTGRTASIHSIAVQNLVHDPGEDVLAAGVTSQLAANLSRIQGVSIQTAAPDAIVEGSVRSADRRVELTVRLIQSRGRKLLWSASYQRDLPGVPALEREIAQKIAGAIGRPLSSLDAAQPAPSSKP
jgi:TolB-like protein